MAHSAICAAASAKRACKHCKNICCIYIALALRPDAEGTALKFYLTQKLCCSDASELKMAATRVAHVVARVIQGSTHCVWDRAIKFHASHMGIVRSTAHNKIILSKARICATGYMMHVCIIIAHINPWKAHSLSYIYNKPVRSAMINTACVRPGYLLRLKMSTWEGPLYLMEYNMHAPVLIFH